MSFNELPVEIQEEMLAEQVKQGNPRNESVFIQNIFASAHDGGFDWSQTKMEGDRWYYVLVDGNHNVFFDFYRNDKMLDKVNLFIKNINSLNSNASYGYFVDWEDDWNHIMPIVAMFDQINPNNHPFLKDYANSLYARSQVMDDIVVIYDISDIKNEIESNIDWFNNLFNEISKVTIHVEDDLITVVSNDGKGKDFISKTDRVFGIENAVKKHLELCNTR